MEGIRVNGRKFFGIILVIAGLILTIDKTGLYNIDVAYIFSNYWPLFIVLAGVLNIVKNSGPKFSGVVTILIGILLQLNISGYFNIFNYLYLWPLILIFIGIRIIFSKGDGSYKDIKQTINALAIFSGSNVRSLSQNFLGGSAVAVFGGVDIDLREANILRGQVVVLDVVSVFGGVDIIVPKEWNVIISGTPIFGGWDNTTVSNKDTDAPILKVNSVVIFGGMDISN